MKLLNVTTGKPGDRHHAQVEYDGPLTVSLAHKAAQKAFGHDSGVTVVDSVTGKGFRVTSSGARRVSDQSVGG